MMMKFQTVEQHANPQGQQREAEKKKDKEKKESKDGDKKKRSKLRGKRLIKGNFRGNEGCPEKPPQSAGEEKQTQGRRG